VSAADRHFALALVRELAESEAPYFAPMGFYDDDHDFLEDLAKRAGEVRGRSFDARLRRVARRLVQYGVLVGQMRGTHKEYFGEPTKQMEYGFAKPGKAALLTRPRDHNCMGPEREAEFLIRHAYPKEED
jgi:hypothetical protein